MMKDSKRLSEWKKHHYIPKQVLSPLVEIIFILNFDVKVKL